MEDYINVAYMHTKRVCKDFEVKNLGKSHDSCVQSDTLLLDDLFHTFQNTCLEIHGLKPANFFSHQVRHGQEP